MLLFILLLYYFYILYYSCFNLLNLIYQNNWESAAKIIMNQKYADFDVILSVKQ